MKNKLKIALSTGVLGMLLFGFTVHAATPALTIYSNNNGSAQITVHGDSNSNISFYYNSGSSGGVQIRNIGTTDASGNFSSNIDVSSFGILSGYSTYVVVNNQQSNMVTWTYGGNNNGQISLSQNNITISRGQQVNITIYGGVYVTGSNSNSNIVAMSINGYQATLTGNNIGTANITFCQQGNQSTCVVLYVTVTDGNNNQSVTFSQNNVSVYNGQSVSVSIYGGSGSYYISNNSNPGAVTANVSGSTLTLSAGTNSGSATILVCQQNYGSGCGSLNVTSNGGYGLGLIRPDSFQITNNVLNRTYSQYSYSNSVEAQAGDIVEFEIKVQTNNYYLNGNNNSLIVDLKDNLPYGLTYLSGSTKVNGSQVVDGITSSGIYLNNFYAGQEQVVKFSAMVNSNQYSGTLTNQLTATMGGSAQTANSFVTIRQRGQVLGAADIVTGPEDVLPIALLLGLISSLPIYYFLVYRKFAKNRSAVRQ